MVLLRGCSHMTSSKIGGWQTPPPSIIKSHKYAYPPTPLNHQKSYIAIPPPPWSRSSSVNDPQCPIIDIFDQIHILKMILKTYFWTEMKATPQTLSQHNSFKKIFFPLFCLCQKNLKSPCLQSWKVIKLNIVKTSIVSNQTPYI